ncbi:MAG: hypothetical protein HFJ36_01090 [Clostridia bacterium]|nr:hypothetical protein [Clostridia bacterium]
MKNKGERGSVTLFVLVICMFVTVMLSAYMINMQNKKQAQEREIDRITESYNQNEQQMEEIYNRTLKRI